MTDPLNIFFQYMITRL